MLHLNHGAVLIVGLLGIITKSCSEVQLLLLWNHSFVESRLRPKDPDSPGPGGFAALGQKSCQGFKFERQKALKFEKKINRLHCAPYYEEQLLHCPNLVKQTCQTSLQNQSIASVAENATALWSSRTASSGCLCIQSCLPPITGTRSMPCTPRAEPWKVEVDSSNLTSGSSFRGLALRQPQSYTNIIDGNHQVFLASSFLSFVETFWTSVFVWSSGLTTGYPFKGGRITMPKVSENYRTFSGNDKPVLERLFNAIPTVAASSKSWSGSPAFPSKCTPWRSKSARRAFMTPICCIPGTGKRTLECKWCRGAHYRQRFHKSNGSPCLERQGNAAHGIAWTMVLCSALFMQYICSTTSTLNIHMFDHEIRSWWHWLFGSLATLSHSCASLLRPAPNDTSIPRGESGE